ncbi:MAG: hypothetical protein IJK89_11230 [Clostridia bacterium]|nr:hypothetical protein [Clostridia bacterium]
MKKHPLLRFLVKLFSIVLSVGLLVGVVNHFYVNGYYYRDVYGEIDKMYDVPYDIRMVNLGTSHGLASFRYPDDGVTRYNLALSGEDIYHDFATLKQFADHLAPGCIVALPISYFSFCMSTEEPSQKRYYAYLDREYLRGFSYETLINAKYVPVLRSGEFIIKDLIRDQELDVGAAMMEDNAGLSDGAAQTVEAGVGETNELTSSLQTATDALSQQQRAEKEAELASHAAGRAESWRSGYMKAGRAYIEENTRILTDMVNFCFENGFRPVLVSTPIYQALNEQFSEEELEICYFEPMRTVAAETGVPYLDLSHDEALSGTPEYYGNSDHMNADGAAAFYERYTECLRQIGYLEEAGS